MNSKKYIWVFIIGSIAILWCLTLFDRCNRNKDIEDRVKEIVQIEEIRRNLKGEKGNLGSTGVQGQKGDKGDKGQKGEKGKDGKLEIIETSIIVDHVDIAEDIILKFHFASGIGSEIDQDSTFITTDWVNELSEELNLRFNYWPESLETWEPIISYKSNVIPIFISESIESPLFISDGYIEMPYKLCKDPVILQHELIHFLTQSNSHVRSQEGWFYKGCNVKKAGCLNLMNDSRSSDQPLTFLLTKEQEENINARVDIIEIDCIDPFEIFHKYPTFLIESKDIESLIDCCETNITNSVAGSSHTGLNSNSKPYLTSFQDIDIDSILEKLIDDGFCLIDIVNDNKRNLDQVLFGDYETNNKKILQDEVVVIAGDKKTKDLIIDQLLKAASDIRKKDPKLKELYEIESNYLAKIFKTKPEKIKNIRRNSFEYMEEIRSNSRDSIPNK